MANPEALEARKWLNATYGNNPDFDKLAEIESTGTALWKGLTQALQIELGITPVSGTFGDKTMAACPTVALNDTDEELGHPFVTIIQYGLYSKGYDPKGATGIYDEDTQAAIIRMQTDAGLQGAQISGPTTPTVFKALLGVEEFKMVSGGDSTIREIQQYLNHTYFSYIGIRACDGIYSRATNQAIIYAFQATEGLPIGVANGNFGNTTKNCCPRIPYTGVQKSYKGTTYSDSAVKEFQRLLQYGLYVNGYNPFNLLKTNVGEFDSNTQQALKNFKKFCALPDADEAVAHLNEWMSFFLSTGNPRRDGTAADTAARLTRSRMQAIVNDGYDTVGRYLTGTFDKGKGKNLLRNELATIFRTYSRPDGTDVNPKLFLIYQFGGDGSGYFNYDQGYSDAEIAFNSLPALRIPENHFIYFAVDYDFMADQVKSRVIPYFQGVKDYRDGHNIPYKIGIYGARNTCTLVREAGLSESSFVGDMSTGYSGNKGFPLPQDWAFDQIQEYPLNTADGSINIDKNVVSGRYEGISHMADDELLNLDSYGDICINISNQSLPVYRVRIGRGESEKMVDEFDSIQPGSFYIVWHPAENSGYHCDYVYFRDSYGNLNGGYTYSFNIEGAQECFGKYSVYYDESATEPYKLVINFEDSVPIPEEEGNAFYMFTVVKPLEVLNSSGVTTETLPVGTRVALQRIGYDQVKSGVSFPAAKIGYVKRPNEGWYGMENYYLDLGIEKYGVTPETRALH